MRIGLTCDTVADWAEDGLDPEDLAEFDAEETVSAIEQAIARRGHTVERIGRAQSLVARLAAGARWDLVFNIAEGLRGLGREALAPALLDTYAIPYTFSDPLVMALTLHKGHTKRVLRDAGLPTAPFVELRVAEEARNVDLPFPLFVKPVAEGTGKGIGPASLCHSRIELAEQAGRLITRFAQPVIAESFCPGREFTVGVLGTGMQAEILAVMEIRARDTYGFDTKKHYEGRVSYRLADDAEARAAGATALAAWRVLGGRDGGRIDLRSDADGKPMLLEVNPLPGLHPIDSDLVIIAQKAGHSHEWLIGRILDSALARMA
jgi:D-alanine-D-alanine ligase